jgi:prepilin-type N-terminal cleavage/methylation domain-containing protein
LQPQRHKGLKEDKKMNKVNMKNSSQHLGVLSALVVNPDGHRDSVPSAYSVHSVVNFRRRAGFSLMEMLIAIFILSLGLIMVAGVFPVAIKWTADDAQSTVGSVIGQNALGIIQADIQHGESLGENPYNIYYSGNLWGGVPYAFGISQPDAPINAASGTNGFKSVTNGTTTNANGVTPLYFWTAYLQQQTSSPNVQSYLTPNTNDGFQAISSAASLYRVYIFVFAKGDPNNTYTTAASLPVPEQPNPYTASVVTTYPQIYSGTFSNVKVGGGATPANTMPLGSLGVDTTTGIVFRETIGTTGTISTVPAITTTDNVLYVPPATGQTDSPLIYIYSTTVSF